MDVILKHMCLNIFVNWDLLFQSFICISAGQIDNAVYWRG